jgi:hypothetical protein
MARELDRVRRVNGCSRRWDSRDPGGFCGAVRRYCRREDDLVEVFGAVGGDRLVMSVMCLRVGMESEEV